MKEWLVVGGGHEDRWPELAGEAYEWVASHSPGTKSAVRRT